MTFQLSVHGQSKALANISTVMSAIYFTQKVRPGQVSQGEMSRAVCRALENGRPLEGATSVRTLLLSFSQLPHLEAVSQAAQTHE